jgi:hypothetical protein
MTVLPSILRASSKHSHIVENRHRLAILMLVLACVCTATFAQQAATERATLPPLPPPIDQPFELPPLPPPTEEQLQRGRELLDKIAYVIANVPLTDAEAVLKVFGFTELSIKEYPTHADVGPKGTTSQFSRIEELAGTGFSYIRVQPWVNDPRIPVTSWLNATLVTKEVCIPIDDVRRIFGPITSRTNSSRIVDIHRIERPTPLHGVGNLSFSPLKNPLDREAGIVFGFEYQTCATDFSFNYRNQPRELNK